MATKLKNSNLQKTLKVLCFLLSCVFVLIGSVSVNALAGIYYSTSTGEFLDGFTLSDDFDIMTSYSFTNVYVKDIDTIMYSALYYDDLSLENFKKIEKDSIEQYCSSQVRDLKNIAECYEIPSKYVKEVFKSSGYVDYSNGVVYRNHYGAVIERSDPSNGLYLRDGKVYEYTIDVESMRNDYIESEYKLFKANAVEYQKRATTIKNLKYAIVNKTDKKVFTNMSGINQKSTSEQIRKVFGSFSWNVFCDSNGGYYLSEEIENHKNNFKNTRQKSLTSIYQKDFSSAKSYSGETPILLVTSIESIQHCHNISDEYEVFVGFDKTCTETDNYSSITSNYFVTRKAIVQNTVAISICVLGAVLCTVYLLVKAGRKANEDEVVLLKTDKIPNILHFAINFGLIFLMLLFFGVLSDIGTSYFGLPIMCVIIYVLLTEWLLSFARHIKNHSLIKNTIIGYILSKIKKIKKEARLPDGKKIFLTTVIISAVYFLVLVFASALIITNERAGIIFLWPLFLTMGGFVVVSVYYIVKIMKATSQAKEGNYDYDLNVTKFPIWLRKLANDVTTMQSGTKTAIENAVKDQKMKTELITNVSHDLKTPLTAIINYIDLLGKCNIDDKTANEYIAVLEDKSMRLKKLIEDLTEAAKASSGNIQLNKVTMNLNEIALQVSGEMSSELEKKNLELVLRLPTQAVNVVADSRLTFRIMENLMSNVSKYSLPNTRVYLNVSEEGYISVINISEDPIEVSADELKNRFVRGDKSRTTEGSGLGLSIADDLCTIQGGKMELYIDGDMFKVTVRFEKAK